jgi:GntR family transcriptional regulator
LSFGWTEFDVTDQLPESWQHDVLKIATEADCREFPRTPVLSREAQDVARIPRGRVHADQVREGLPWLYQSYRKGFLELAERTVAEPVMPAADERYGVVLNVQRGTEMRFECHVDSNPLTGLLFLTEHAEGTGGELVFAHDPDADSVAAVERDRTVIRPRGGLLIFFDGRRHPHYARALLSESDVRVVAVMNYYTGSYPESTRPAALNQHLYGDGLPASSAFRTRYLLGTIGLGRTAMANPMYRQIAEDLRAQIEAGGLVPGQQLSTEIELREHYGASRNTVRDAIKWLTTVGLVETRPGQGTFVVQKMEPSITTLTGSPAVPSLYGEVDDSSAGEIAGRERALASSAPQIEIQKAPAGIARLLQIAEGSQVISRHQKRYIDGTPWSMQTSFYPMEFVRKGAERLIQADDIAIGTMKYLEQNLGLKQVGYRDWITVRTADSAEAAFFNVPPDGRVGVFEVFRTAYDQTYTPMRLTVTVYPTDRNQFIVNVGDVPDSGDGAGV